jgi:hypothetical protein
MSTKDGFMLTISTYRVKNGGGSMLLDQRAFEPAVIAANSASQRRRSMQYPQTEAERRFMRCSNKPGRRRQGSG